MTDRKCGSCKYYIPEDKPPADMITRARTKLAHPFATCQADGKPRNENDRPCLIWMAIRASPETNKPDSNKNGEDDFDGQ